ncbi:hypothetical protein BDW74DRAFT_8070 [Aspergillus multicolor]|uniref:uncharacterized protein n=1 Tax=Aspergillus multicolor TaxID=41759 RepID=UPI003CCD969A
MKGESARHRVVSWSFHVRQSSTAWKPPGHWLKRKTAEDIPISLCNKLSTKKETNDASAMTETVRCRQQRNSKMSGLNPTYPSFTPLPPLEPLSVCSAIVDVAISSKPLESSGSSDILRQRGSQDLGSLRTRLECRKSVPCGVREIPVVAHHLPIGRNCHENIK